GSADLLRAVHADAAGSVLDTSVHPWGASNMGIFIRAGLFVLLNGQWVTDVAWARDALTPLPPLEGRGGPLTDRGGPVETSPVPVATAAPVVPVKPVVTSDPHDSTRNCYDRFFAVNYTAYMECVNGS